MDYAIVISCQKAAYVLHKLNWAHVDREWRRKMFPSTEQLILDFWSVTVWIPIAVLYNLALSWLAKTCLAQCLVQWMTLFREMCMFCWSFREFASGNLPIATSEWWVTRTNPACSVPPFSSMSDCTRCSIDKTIVVCISLHYFVYLLWDLKKNFHCYFRC